ncbi:MAG: hypothetical protein V3V04_00755 [Rhizobiaceae bacterium]
MTKANVGSGGNIEKAIWFLAGNIMALLGTGMAYLCYKWALEPKYFEFRYIWVAGAASLSLLLMRGAWFTIFPAPQEPTRFRTRGE